MAKTKKSETMTVKQFCRLYGNAETDTRELAEAAVKVDGEVGQAAAALLVALDRFDGALEAIGFGDEE